MTEILATAHFYFHFGNDKISAVELCNMLMSLGVNRHEAQLLMQRSTDYGYIRIDTDWKLSVAQWFIEKHKLTTWR